MSENEEAISLKTARSVPFFLRVVAILLLVTGIVGGVFYLLVAVFQISGRNFLYNEEYKGFSGLAYYAILTIQVLLYGGLVLSGILLLRLKRSGVYLFALSYLVFTVLGFLLQEEYGWSMPVAGIVVLVIIWLHKNKLIN